MAVAGRTRTMDKHCTLSPRDAGGRRNQVAEAKASLRFSDYIGASSSRDGGSTLRSYSPAATS